MVAFYDIHGENGRSVILNPHGENTGTIWYFPKKLITVNPGSNSLFCFLVVRPSISKTTDATLLMYSPVIFIVSKVFDLDRSAIIVYVRVFPYNSPVGEGRLISHVRFYV